MEKDVIKLESSYWDAILVVTQKIPIIGGVLKNNETPTKTKNQNNKKNHPLITTSAMPVGASGRFTTRIYNKKHYQLIKQRLTDSCRGDSPASIN